MDINRFLNEKRLSKDGKYYYAKEGETMYIQPVNQSKQYRLPKELQKFKKIALWQVGPDGKHLFINNLEVTA